MTSEENKKYFGINSLTPATDACIEGHGPMAWVTDMTPLVISMEVGGWWVR